MSVRDRGGWEGVYLVLRVTGGYLIRQLGMGRAPDHEIDVRGFEAVHRAEEGVARVSVLFTWASSCSVTSSSTTRSSAGILISAASP